MNGQECGHPRRTGRTPAQSHCVSLSPPCRGRYQRPGGAGSAVSLEGAALRLKDVLTPAQSHCVSLSPPFRGRYQRPGGAGSAVSLEGAALRLPQKGTSLLMSSLLTDLTPHDLTASRPHSYGLTPH